MLTAEAPAKTLTLADRSIAIESETNPQPFEIKNQSLVRKATKLEQMTEAMEVVMLAIAIVPPPCLLVIGILY